MDSTLLVERSKSGDTEAYGRLVEKYQDYVFAICLAYLRQQDLAGDASQEVFLAAFQNIRNLQEADRFQAWLKRMTINHCLDEVRKKRRFLVSSLEELREEDILRSAQFPAREDFDSVEQVTMVYMGLLLLKAPEKKILTWHHLHGLAIAPIAEMLGVSVSAAKKRLERARKALKKEMETMDIKLAVGQGFSKKIIDLINRPDLITVPGNPVFDIWSEIRKLLPDFQFIEGNEITERAQEQETIRTSESFMSIALDQNRSLRTQTTSVVLDYIKSHPETPCRIVTAGRVWRDDKEDEKHLKMFHQLDMLIMGPDVREGDIVSLMSDLTIKLFPGKTVRWELADFALVKRLWKIGVENNGSTEEFGAGGEFRSEILQHCGVDSSRFTVVGLGIGLERLAMIRYGINDIRSVQSAR
jgi:RNA polymerase sigma-70 factor (ECF subfamily)